MKKHLLIIALLMPGMALHAQRFIATVDSLLVSAEYTKAIAVLESKGNVSDPSLTPLIENKKAEALTRLGKLDEAETILKTLGDKGTAYLKGITQTNLGLLYLNRGRYDLALESLQQALRYFNEDNKSNGLEAAQAMAYLGQVYKFTGKHAQAEEQLNMALTLRRNLLKEDHELIAASYNDLGLAYAQLDNDKALDYYEKALTLYAKLHGKEHPKIAIANSNIGFVYRDLELYGDAVNNFEAALKIWEKVYTTPHQTKAFVLFNLGQTYLKMGDQKAALGFYERALAMYRSSYGNKHPEIATVLNAMGALKTAGGNYDEALQHFQQAMKANVRDFESDATATNPPLRDFYNGNVLLYSLLLKAEALEGRHFGKSLKFSDLKIALATLQRCDSLIDRLRQQSSNESDKIALGVIANDVYADGVRIAHEAATTAFIKKDYLAMAFYFAEKSKSAVLLEAISESDAKSFAGIPAPLLEEEKSLKSAIAITAQKLAQKPSPEEERHLRETSFSLNRSYEDFVRKLEKQFPGYFNLKYNAASPSIADLQRLLDDQTAMLSYFIDEKNARLYIFQITRKSYRIVDHALPPTFDKQITGLRNSVYFNVKDAYTKVAANLGKLLIPSVGARIKNLVILPAGRLSIIPFEALLTRSAGATQEYAALPYLLQRFTVRYEFSAGLLLQKAKQPAPRTPSIFLCAPVTFPEKDNLNALPGTADEVKEISALFASNNISQALYTGEKATEHLVKSSGLKNYSLLHFATHGVADENAPELSRIFLQSTSAAEDGNLFASEIYNLEMDANLVTLSACQTGLGKISKGEGVIGLSRALVYAGARNIVVSFWSVADESTAGLMKTFYKRLIENPGGYCHSLRQAKLALMADEKYAAPYYWAPFILIGF
jgi:CHAT domain-containing protein/Tfp pilus assembly protein PilF